MSRWHGNPRKRFYMTVAQGNTDGTIDLHFELPNGYDSEAQAVEAASEAADEYGGEYFVYECRPVKRVSRVTVHVDDVEEEPR